MSPLRWRWIERVGHWVLIRLLHLYARVWLWIGFTLASELAREVVKSQVGGATGSGERPEGSSEGPRRTTLTNERHPPADPHRHPENN